MSQISSTARDYANVLETKTETYANYHNFTPTMGEIKNYRFGARIGSGSFSIVYEGLYLPSQTPVVLKLLKPPTKTIKIKREIKILEALSEGINIIRFLDAVDYDIVGGTTALIFEKVSTTSFHEIYHTLDKNDIKLYTYEILKGVNYCHSMGIMHRDIKPENMIIDRERKIVKLIDFGLAQFYLPHKKYSAKVCSLPYMAPELLVNYRYYNYSVDLWSLGCLFAAMMFQKHPFFFGTNMANQLLKIVSVLGSTELTTYLEKYNIDVGSPIAAERKDWEAFVNKANGHLRSEQAFDLLDGMLCYDHVKRITAREALLHPYFATVTDDGHN